MRAFITAVTAVFLCLVPIENAVAAACGENDDMIARLEQQFGERSLATMLDQRGAVIRLLVNAETGTWTILATTTAGSSCIVAAGDAFQPAAFETTPSLEG